MLRLVCACLMYSALLLASCTRPALARQEAPAHGSNRHSVEFRERQRLIEQLHALSAQYLGRISAARAEVCERRRQLQRPPCTPVPPAPPPALARPATDDAQLREIRRLRQEIDTRRETLRRLERLRAALDAELAGRNR